MGLGAEAACCGCCSVLVATACGDGAGDQVDPGTRYGRRGVRRLSGFLRRMPRKRIAVLIGSTADHWDFGPMPPVEGLSENDVEAIIAFVRQRQREDGFELYPP